VQIIRPKSAAVAVAIGLIIPLVIPVSAFAQDTEAADPASAETTEEAPQETAMVRFLDGSHSMNMDFYVDDAPMVTGLEDGGITEYMEVPAGKHRVSVAANDQSSLDEATVKLKANTRTTVAGISGEDSAATVVQYVQDKPKPAVGSSRLRIVNLCSNCGTVDVMPDASKKQRLAKMLDFPKSTKYMKVKPGELDLMVRSGEDTWDLDPIAIEASTAGTLFLTRWIVDGTFLPIFVTDAGASTLMFLNPAREGAPVDVYVDAELVAQKLGPGSMRKPVALPSGEHLVQVVAAGTMPADGALVEADLDLEPGPLAMIVGVGSAVEAVPVPTSRGPGAETPRIRFVHADAETPSIDIELRDLAPVLNLEFGEATDYITLAEESSYFWIRPADGSGGPFHEAPLDLGPGNYTAYVGGTPEPPTIDIAVVQDKLAKTKK
jgi:hypothetical protein